MSDHFPFPSPPQQPSANQQQPHVPYGYVPYGIPPVQRDRKDGLAIAGMVLGIASLLFGWLWLIPAVLAIVFSSVALSRIRKSEGRRAGRGMAIAGLVTGIVSAGFWALIFLAALSA